MTYVLDNFDEICAQHDEAYDEILGLIMLPEDGEL